MKKRILSVTFALTAIVFTSCKKEYTCNCSTTVLGSTTTSSTKTEKMSKKDAKAKCEANNGTVTVLGASYTVSCKID